MITNQGQYMQFGFILLFFLFFSSLKFADAQERQIQIIESCFSAKKNLKEWRKKDSDKCENEAYKLAKKSNKVSIRQAIAVHMFRNYDKLGALKFFELSVDSSRKSSCKDGHVQEGVLLSLSKKSSDTHKVAKKLLKSCFNELETNLKNKMNNERNANLWDQACPLLIEKNSLKSLMKKKCEKYSK